MAEGIIYAWFVMTGLSLLFVIIDLPKTPESIVLKWAFVILVAFTGPLGAFFYVLGCREPLKGSHEKYVSVRWRQVLGSTMHCAAGDGLGIIAGAVIGAILQYSSWKEFSIEYVLGFGFGWAYFQAFAMRDMVGGSYILSLKETFIPELLSMNVLMAGMIPTMRALMPLIEGAEDPFQLAFWFVMSMALIVAFALAYPVNWWLVANNMKHGMLTIRPMLNSSTENKSHEAHGDSTVEDSSDHDEHDGGSGDHDDHGSGERPGAGTILFMSAITFSFMLAGLWLAGGFFS